MSREEIHAQDAELNDEVLLDDEMSDSDKESESNGAIGWFISLGLHALFGLIFYYAVFAAKDKDKELPPMRVVTLDPPPKKEEKKEKVRDFDDKVEIKITTEAEVAAPLDNIKAPVEELNTSEEDTIAEMVKGREEAVSNVELGQTGAFMAIGVGGSAAGMFGNRNGGGKRRALATGGGSPASEGSVEAALRWFKRHQSPNGMWDVEKYPVNCTETPKCEPGVQHKASDANIACTGYAVLCYLGAGYDHKTFSKYKSTVEKGLEYLRSVQTESGELGPRNYEHAIATMALAEAYAMTTDPELKQPSQKGLNIIMERQAREGGGESSGGLGWNYKEAAPNRNDSSVTGWCVMALKSGLAGGLNVGNSMEGAKNWLGKAWKASNPEWQKLTDPYTATSKFPYTYDAVADKASEGDNRYSMGALCAVFLGHHSGDIMLDSMINSIMKEQFVQSYPTNTYYMYYNTLAVFQAGGANWKKWNDTVRDVLVNSQRRSEDCFDGSWDFEGTKFHGSETGRVLSTAFCCLSLEVYYRYKQSGAK